MSFHVRKIGCDELKLQPQGGKLYSPPFVGIKLGNGGFRKYNYIITQDNHHMVWRPNYCKIIKITAILEPALTRPKYPVAPKE